ncbi:DUF2971 domain-containing protein [Cupriavidus oxalaticus]|uniref:DUF2971 domain-containing protein n=1 Tax=Cupriavidus oxalaticus TaxID=96344 RepID=A0A5P3VRJ9_9BURK|nr:DUF2971 domain-containing protein [Cupriavidus oxalaticus]QEZ48757.1 DUF2971 domain-containing protein [Cupriavidus oxalaticus]
MRPSLYKFMAIHKAEYIDWFTSILEGRIYYSSPTSFNDPFEMSSLLAPLDKSVFATQRRMAGYIPVTPSQSRAEYGRYLNEFSAKPRPALSSDWIEGLGVLCLTTQKDNLLMWAHYAANHSGVCIGFDSGYEPFTDAQPVLYSERRPAVSSRTPDMELLRGALLTKSPHWSYEKEWRAIKRTISDHEKEYYKGLIARDSTNIDAVATVLSTQGGCGQYEFDPKAIRVICLGARIKRGDASKIIELTRNHCPHVRIEEARLDGRYYQINFERRSR